MLRWLIVFLALPSFGGVTILSVDATRQQGIVVFSVADPAHCTVTVYSDAAFTLKMDDTNSALFAGSESCNRAANIIDGSRVTAVLGLRNSAPALDGKMHSRSLAVSTPYWVKITDTLNGVSATTSFTTSNIPWGDTHPEPPPFHPAGFGNWGYPDLDWTDAGANKWYIDPLAGLPFRRIPRDEIGGGGVYDNQPSDRFPFGGVFDITKEKTSVATWTNLSNALKTSTAGPFASYSGTGRDPLFYALDRIGQITPYEVTHSFDDLQLHLYGSAPGCTGEDCKVLVCLATMYNPQTDVCTPELEVILPTAAAQRDFPVAPNYPKYQFNGWQVGHILRTEEYGVWGSKNSPGNGNSADAVAAASTVGLSIGSDGDTLLPLWAAPGMKININGTWYTLGTINTARAFSLQESGITATGKWFLANVGIRIRKKTATNNTINIAGDFSIVTTRIPQVSSYSEKDWCSKLDFPLSVAADGVTAIPTKRARLCQVGEYGGTTQLLLVADDGEIRYLSPLLASGINVPFSVFSTSDPFTVYGFGQDNTNSAYAALYTATYKPGNGCNYKTWTGNNYLTVSPPSDCVVYTNVTPASSNLSVTQQIAAVMTANPIWDPTFTAAKLCGGSASDAGAACFTLTGIGGHYAYFAAGAQDGVQFLAGVDVNTGRLAKFFDTFSNVINGLRFSGIHSGGNSDGDHWFEFEAKALYGAGWPYLTGPWVLPANGVSQKSTDGITYTNDTSLTANSPYGWTCGANAAGITGAQCVWLHLTTNEVCNVNSNGTFSTEITRWPCSWHSGWTKGPIRIGVGDYLSIAYNSGTRIDGKNEKMRILTMAADGAGGYYAMMQRHATCDNPTGDINGTPPAVLYFRALDNQSTFANGWQAYVAPPQACDSLSVWFDSSLPLNQTSVAKWVSLPIQHGGNGVGPDGMQRTEGGGGYFRTAPFQDLEGTSAHKQQEVSNVPWNGVLNGGSDNVMEIYSAITNWQATTQLSRSLSFDARHMNPPGGAYPEKNGITLYNHVYTPVANTSYVYKTDILGNARDHKTWRPVTQSTVGLWHDISSPVTGSNQITDATPWASCYAYKANECRVGSAAGDYFVWAKNMWMESNACVISTLKDSSPCTMAPWPQSGWIVQNYTQADDPRGTHFRRLTMGLVGPFSAYHYSSPHVVPDHKFMFVRYSYPNGMAPAPLLYKLPPPPVEDSIDRSNPIPVAVSLPSGSGYRRIKFGYAENGGATQFFCTTRQEACFTDANITPFAYETSDTLTATNCTAGCTIKVPALSGRVLYYRVERSANGSTGWVAGPTQVIGIK